MAPVGKTIRVASIREHGHALKDIRTPSRFSYAAKSIFVFVYVRVYFLSLSLSLFVVLRIQRERAGGIFRNNNGTIQNSQNLSFLLLRSKKSTRRHTHTQRQRERDCEIDLNARKETIARSTRALVFFFFFSVFPLLSKFFDAIRRRRRKRESRFSYV
jgi:hypothetical protein